EADGEEAGEHGGGASRFRFGHDSPRIQVAVADRAALTGLHGGGAHGALDERIYPHGHRLRQRDGVARDFAVAVSRWRRRGHRENRSACDGGRRSNFRVVAAFRTWILVFVSAEHEAVGALDDLSLV